MQSRHAKWEPTLPFESESARYLLPEISLELPVLFLQLTKAINDDLWVT